MDINEVTDLLISKINHIDSQNASKIIGHILFFFPHPELARLASAPDHVFHAIVLRVKQQLYLSPSSHSPIPNSIPKSPSSSANPLFHSSPSSPSLPLSGFPNSPISPKFSPSHSCDAIFLGSVSKPCLSPRGRLDSNTVKGCVDEYQMSDYFSFLNNVMNNVMNEDLVDPNIESVPGGLNSVVNNGDAIYHRRSYSAGDACFGYGNAGHRTCLYFANGFCKHGSSCKFMHGAMTDSVDAIVGFPTKFEDLRVAQHQSSLPPSPVMSPLSPYSTQQQKNFHRGGTITMGDEFHKFNRRNDFLAERPHSPSRQIYLTFPAESAFKDEDVSEYFGKFGPVQDVRIPYQQSRMFGFVTFVYPETVRLILSKGNPHFICDSRVLVKPYKEKGKVLDKRQQQLERREFSPPLSFPGFDSKEPHDFHLGARILYNPHEITMRRKFEEQAELQQAIELQERRQMNLQLPYFKNQHHQRSSSVGSFSPLPQIHSHISNPGLSPNSIKRDITGFSGNPISSISLGEQQQPLQEIDPSASCIDNNGSGNEKNGTKFEFTDPCNRSVEQALPDSLSASPTKSAVGNLSDFSTLEKLGENALSSARSASPNELQDTSTDMSPH